MRVFSWENVVADNGAALLAFLRAWAEETASSKGMEAFSALTIGDFDGCHLGHAALFKKVVAASKRSLIEKNADVLVPGAVTFRRDLSSPEKGGKLSGCISTLRQRFKAMEAHGLAFVLLIDFSCDFSKMDGSDFLKTLSEVAQMRYLAVGEDFRCGFKLRVGKKEITRDACRFGFDFEPLLQVLLDGRRVSSTEIRKAVSRADFAAVGRLLGRPFVFDISDVAFQSLGVERALSAFYAPYGAFAQVLPPAGRYSVALRGEKTEMSECVCVLDGQAVLIECEKKLLLCKGRIVEGETANAFFDELKAYSEIEFFLRSKHGSC